MNMPLIDGYGTEGAELLAATFIDLNWMEFTAWAGTRYVNHAECTNWVRRQIGEQQRLVGPK